MSTNESSIRIHGLGAFATYHIKISFVNNITKIIGESVITDFHSLSTKPGGKNVINNI